LRRGVRISEIEAFARDHHHACRQPFDNRGQLLEVVGDQP
jgi:hypothetical protein